MKLRKSAPIKSYLKKLAKKQFFENYSIVMRFFRAGHSLFISRFAHRSIALKKPVVSSRKRALNRKIAPKTTAVRSYVCIVCV